MEHKGTGFTLVELLVVVAIIAILAGLLLPTLGRAKAKGQSAVCQSNLKQLMLGWTQYADDNDDRLAGSYLGGLGESARLVGARQHQARSDGEQYYVGRHLQICSGRGRVSLPGRTMQQSMARRSCCAPGVTHLTPG